MKRNCFVICLLLLLLLSACGEPRETAEADPVLPAAQTQSPTAPEVPVSDETTASAASEEPEKTDYPEYIPWVYKIPGKKIYVNVPDWKDLERGYVEEFCIYEEQMISVLGNCSSSAASLEEAQTECTEMWKVCQDMLSANTFTVTAEQTGTMNGIDYYRYEGLWNCGDADPFDAYTVGYTFFMDGIPVNIQGIVLDPAQPQATIDNIKMITDASMKTVRDAE